MNVLDRDAKRAPVTGTRVVRSKQDVRSPQKGASGPGFGTFNSLEDKKRRPYTTPSRPSSFDTKRDPNTPTRTVRPYRPNTGGRDRLLSPEAAGGNASTTGVTPGMLTVVGEDEAVGLMGQNEYMAEDIEGENAEIEWIDEESGGEGACTSRPVCVSDSPPALPAASQAPSPKPTRKAHVLPTQLDLGLSNQSSPSPAPVNFGKDGCKVRTGSKTLIGKGSFGCVFKGLHEGTNQIVAIKEIHLSGESAGKVNMIKKEIQMMKRLNHPNIVRYGGAFFVPLSLIF